MACGDTYRDEVVTVDGYTLDNPYGAVALSGDYRGWRQLAENIWVRMDTRWQQLGNVEPAPYVFWNANVEKKNDLTHRVDDLPWSLPLMPTGATITGAIDEAMKRIAELNCFRERIDKRLVELGETPEELPDAGTPDPATKPGDMVPIVVGGVLGVAAIYVVGAHVVPAILKKG